MNNEDGIYSVCTQTYSVLFPQRTFIFIHSFFIHPINQMHLYKTHEIKIHPKDAIIIQGHYTLDMSHNIQNTSFKHFLYWMLQAMGITFHALNRRKSNRI
jgi:hypothetical protein